MAIDHVYVDPSIAGDSGVGTSGDPYGDLQYALNQEATHDTTEGRQFNIKQGTAEVLSGSLDFTSYTGSPSATAPLIFKGYKTAANDITPADVDAGTLGAIQGDGSNPIYNATHSYAIFMHLELDGQNATPAMHLGNLNIAYACHIHDSSSVVLSIGDSNYVVGCNIYDGATGIESQTDPKIIGNFINGMTTQAMSGLGNNALVLFNMIVSTTATAHGINCTSGHDVFIANNSAICTATGSSNNGIAIGSGLRKSSCAGNLIEGFYNGIQYNSSSRNYLIEGQHAAYNAVNANYQSEPDRVVDLGDRVVLGETPFTKGTLSFANRMSYFAPKDIAASNIVGGVSLGTWVTGTTKGHVQLYKGAVQPFAS